MSRFVSPAPVGVIGAGAMGMGVVASLLRNGHPVTVCDIAAPARAEAQARGATLAASPAEVAARCAAVIVLVVDAQQMERVLTGPQGAHDSLTPDHVVLACSTIAPEDVARLAESVRATGATLVDAPVSGGPARAHDGTMSMMVAAPADALEACEPLFAAMAGKVFRVGSKRATRRTSRSSTTCSRPSISPQRPRPWRSPPRRDSIPRSCRPWWTRARARAGSATTA